MAGSRVPMERYSFDASCWRPYLKFEGHGTNLGVACTAKLDSGPQHRRKLGLRAILGQLRGGVCSEHVTFFGYLSLPAQTRLLTQRQQPFLLDENSIPASPPDIHRTSRPPSMS